MATMEDLLQNQEQTSAAIEQVYSNFKKDGADRKTADYIKRRLTTLDGYWQEYQSNHMQLCGFGDKSHAYFTSNQYEIVKDRFSNIRTAIQNYEPSKREPKETLPPLIRPATPLGLLPGQQGQQPSFSINQSHQASPSKTDEMIRKQTSNFKAFEHTITNIMLDTVSEKWEFDHLLRVINSRWSAIDSLHWELDSVLGGRDPNYEATFFKYERSYNNAIKSINQKMWSISHRDKSTPQIEIPTFNGSYHQWTSFKDLFTETIHSNPSLSSAQKMQFLKSKVKGEAERLIQHLPIASDNYSICWDILNHRFDNKKLILNSLIEIMLNIPVASQPSYNHIKKIHDAILESLNAIKNLGIDVDSWDPLLIYLMCQKLDADTHKEYVASVKSPRDVPNITEFLSFLESKFTTIESSRRKQEQHFNKPITRSNVQNYQNNQSYSGPKYHKVITKQPFQSTGRAISQPIPNRNVYVTKFFKCPICQTDDHGVFHCQQFIDMSPYVKRTTVAKYKLCQNCLYCHQGKACISEKRCRECNQAHNTLLHGAFEKPEHASGATNSGARGGVSKPEPAQGMRSNSHVSLQRDVPEILLATALIKVQKADGSYIKIRALLDQGSQTSLITENAAQLLGLPRQRCHGVISGVGIKESNCKGTIHLKCLSINSNFEFETDALIMQNLIKNLPSNSFIKPTWSYLENISLADPEFNLSNPVDLLLGADIYSLILLEGICRSDQNSPIAQNTRLGWILSGNVKTLHCNVVLTNLEEIHKFWEIEDIIDEPTLSTEDQQCIQYYKDTTTRRADGRYEVRLPLKNNFQNNLGNSKSKAIAQFRSLERKFSKNNVMEKDYKSFMEEYQSLGHMTLATNNSTSDVYLTHHGVERTESTSTKFRVVFNASAKTTSGRSLNDVMASGPNLQQDLQSLIIKWRQFQFAFTADIEKMFRQIWMTLEDQKYQKIVWRNSTHVPIKDYQLATVTYGTKAAPFLAMMTLKQLASDERSNYINSPAADVLEQSFYMDDLVYGQHNILAAQQLCSDLIHLLKAGGFNLRKWKSNIPQLNDVKSNNQENFSFKRTEQTKTLGLSWDPQQDTLSFDIKIDQSSKLDTKRSLLSAISKLFDPLGLLAPLSTKLKIIFQNVWLSEIRWDDPLTQEIQTEWIKVKDDMKNINRIKINRWIKTMEGDSIELHGFCDASTKAYACVIYCIIRRGEKSDVTLFVGKARLVPTKSTISLPKLELSGALLLSKLMLKVKHCLSDYNIKVYGWCDSMICLGWLNGDPARWKTFISNRVKQITEVMPAECWRYVKSEENPADCASRGLTATQLIDHPLWWKGPSWLPNYNEEEVRPTYSTDLELKQSKQVNVVTEHDLDNDIIYQLLSKHSSFIKIVRILAWILRFMSKERIYKQNYLSISELNISKTIIIKYIQNQEFTTEITSLKQNNLISTKSKISQLNPFLDKDGILRVGGRLRNAQIDLEMKHPIIIPNNCRLAELIIDQSHMLVFHGGARLTSAFIRRKYWIVGGNRAIKKQLRGCVKCRRHDPVKHDQIMGDLPAARTTPSRPFYHTGVDLTGFVDVKSSKGRGIKTTKGYIAVFVCMVTKAVHLEIVSDLTSSTFLAALRRFAARRGAPGHVYSDNGTNFVGASRTLNQEFMDLQSTLDEHFFTAITDMEIQWHFLAPSWPSAGGLWESAVKSLKYHLKRVVGEQKLTYEEYSTLLAQLEACLNARPLCALTEDCEDLDYLTPSHFLASGPTLTIIETEKDHRTRWQLTQKIFDDVWQRWQNEYLCQLSARSKWRQPKENLKVDDIVIINDANLPAGKWALGRIVALHPGKDGYVRVVTLKTKNGLMKRPVCKISLLPVNQYQEQTQPNLKQENVTASITTEKRRSKSTYHSNTINFLYLICLWLVMIISPAYSSFEISSLNISQGIYFDRIANMRLEQDQWKLVIYYDMAPYWQGTELLGKYINHLDGSCMNHNKTIPQCDVVLLQLHHGFTELQHYNGILLGQQLTRRSRVRRGYINGVGSIANTLFGVLDENFAEKYERDIQTVRDNEKHLALLWRNQTSVVEAEFNLIKRVETSVNKQHKSFNLHLNNLERELNKQKNELQNTVNMNDFTLSSVIANSVLTNLQNIQETLVDSITNIYLGKFNFHLLTPDQLRYELNIITGLLSKDLSLPLHNIQSDLSKMYHLLTVKARALKNFIIFEVNIPLVSRDNFDIYKLIPIPQKINNNMINIIPVSDYVAVNIQKDSYVPMHDRDIQDCVRYDTDTFLCPLKQPVYLMQSDENLCIKNIESNQCETITTVCKNIWTELRNMNTYLFFCCGQCTVRVICEDHVSAEQLNMAGIITISDECIIKGTTFTVYPHKRLSNTIDIKADVIKVNIPPINHIINLSIPISAFETQSATTGHQKELEEINQQIQDMKASASENVLADRVSYHDVHHYAVIYLVVACGVVVLIVVVARRLRKRARRAPQPQTPQAGTQAASQPTVQCISESVMMNQCSAVNVNQCDLSSARVLNKATSPIREREFSSL